MAESIDDNQESIIKEAVQHFVDAKLQGQELDIDEFVRQYPGLDRQIRQSIQDMQKIDALFDSLVQADESDFVDTATGRDLVGRNIGSFEIVEMIGRGGMGVVYLARDTKLDRSVAIKSMPVSLAGDSTARMRFKREAKLLASLNHPNIAVIHEIIEQDDGVSYLILEFVPGETLAECIAGEPLKLDQALSIGQQIAEAVSTAHKKGIVHRDLKPSNIKITLDDRVKVLDFGLAKAVGGEPSEKPTTATEPGRVIGTPAYMSPEQARGKVTDHRTDIWSFGCIMYQMLTGKLPFEGETATDTLARIIEREPDWELLPQETPANIRVLLLRCLEKDPDRRLGDIADASIEISETLSKPQIAPTAKLRRIAMIIGSAIIIVGLLGLALFFTLNKRYPTENAQAYEYYLRGIEYFSRDDTETNMGLAIRMYEKAIELDPNFALAYARLSKVYSHMYWFKHDRSDARLAMAEKAVRKALELNPDLPEAHHSLGCYYYWGHLDYDRALEEFAVARRSQPDNGQLLAKIAFVYRRQGNIEEAAVTLEKAIELDPLDPGLRHNQGQTLILLRKYPEAEPNFDRAISGRPDWPDPYAWKAQLYLLWEGRTEKARAVLKEASQYIGAKEYDSILLQTVLFEIFDRNYQKALERLSTGSSEFFETEFLVVPKAQLYAQINGLMGNRQLEQHYYDLARSLIESRIAEDPNDARLHSKLGIAYAGLGRKEDALREGKLTVELLPVTKEAWQGLYGVEDLARIYVMVDQYDDAIDTIEYLLSRPGVLSIPLLRLDPAWDPLRDHPRFKKLLEAGNYWQSGK
ncbi:MAG: protein kinase [Planctomycetota bacterium]